ncbi:TAXI family TRAP transporter solute-binding subunit [Halomonas alkalisoli]|uniref:TAXI family TRAP transporter solute-binding subunit n=1 Tax=Halomonas alkalisoli TaxID=2907158 RepID=UPI001F28BB0D|nr:TAXI family TRAP transporter solute-binding subunit [Halomonas alkalisoli]MCE9681523.1 TAXI family TRAP transporter solute-binding subunit [Halomonas alkalisoli]
MKLTTPRSTRLLKGTGLAGLTALALSFGGTAQAQPSNLSLLSGSPGGTWYPITAGIAEIFGSEGTRTNAEVGAGLANVSRVSAGQAELGVTTSTVPPVAQAGQDPFNEPITNVRALAALFPSYQHVGVTQASGIESVEELVGVSVNCMALGNSTQAAFVDRLVAAGISEDDLDCARGSHNFASDAIKDGNLKGFTLLSGYPNGTFTELFHTVDMKLLPLSAEEFERISEINPGYAYADIPAGSYPGQEDDIPTVVSDLILFSHEDMSDEDAYWIVKTMLDNIERIRGVHAAMAPLTGEYMANIAGIELHPGAVRAYEEAGVEINNTF